MGQLVGKFAGGAAAAAVGAFMTATTAAAEVSGPSDREISRALNCHHGSETREWNASEKRAQQGMIKVSGIGGDMLFLDPDKNHGEPYEGEVGFGISGNGSFKAWGDDEGFRVSVSPDAKNGSLVAIFSDLDAGDSLTFDDWGEQTVRGIDGAVGYVAGEMKGWDINIIAGPTSTALSRLFFTFCKKKESDGGSTSPAGHEGDVETPDVGAPSFGIN